MKMNLQLFGYDDGFYYGQCKLICETETVAGNGKTVIISGNGKTWSGTVVNKLCSFLIPGRGQYTISLMNGATTLWSGVVEAGYGECIHVMLADGYEAVMEKSKLTLAEIEASVGSVADYVPDADCVKTLNNNLSANSKAFIFDYHDGKYGYNTNPNRGADTFVPFSGGGTVAYGCWQLLYIPGSGTYNNIQVITTDLGNEYFTNVYNSGSHTYTLTCNKKCKVRVYLPNNPELIAKVFINNVPFTSAITELDINIGDILKFTYLDKGASSGHSSYPLCVEII